MSNRLIVILETKKNFQIRICGTLNHTDTYTIDKDIQIIKFSQYDLLATVSEKFCVHIGNSKRVINF